MQVEIPDDGVVDPLAAGPVKADVVRSPQEQDMPASAPAVYKNVTIAGGPAAARAYIEDLMRDVVEGRIEPGRVFDRTITLDQASDGYRAMNDREAIKVLINL